MVLFMMTPPRPIKDLLLAPDLEKDEVSALLAPFGIREIKKADTNLQLIAGEPPDRLLFSEILEESLIAFSESPIPDQALNNFERFSKTTFSKTHFFSFLQASPRSLHQLAFVFGGSPFLSDILIRNPEYFYWVFSLDCLCSPKSKSAYRNELRASLRLAKSKSGGLDRLRIFKRKEILRIGVRDLLREARVETSLRELSTLADVLIEEAYTLCDRALRKTFGKPQSKHGRAKDIGSGFTVLALGKLGSRELNFSSDVDLIYLYDSGLEKTPSLKGQEGMDSSTYFEGLARELTSALNDSTEQGYVYRVDLRLRPEGDIGPIALSIEGYRLYYKKRAVIWERLALLRARVVAGDRSLGRRFLDLAGGFIYDQPFGQEGMDEVRACKAQIDESIAIDHLAHRDVKRGYGGIREIEFIVQSLQLYFGSKDPKSRKISTMNGLRQLTSLGHLSKGSESSLRKAYHFLRDLENKLQMVNDRQTHLIPEDPDEFQALALRLGYIEGDTKSASDLLKADLASHTANVHRIFQTLFYPEAASKD